MPYFDRFQYVENRLRAIVKEVYVQDAHDDKLSDYIWAVVIRFRLLSHFLLFHLDQSYSQMDPTLYKTAFRNHALYYCPFLGPNNSLEDFFDNIISKGTNSMTYRHHI